MTHTYIKKEWMVLCKDVFQNMNNKRYRGNVMVVLMEDIMLEIELHKRFYNQVFIGLPFLKMQENLFYLVMNAKELVIFLDAMKCL
jgi:hypothetical protein